MLMTARRPSLVVDAFQSVSWPIRGATTPYSSCTLRMAASVATSEDDSTLATSKGLLKRDRYVATNRFAVRPGKAAKFEQRWANRKSRLASLPGFRYFHLMRRVTKKQQDQRSDVGDAFVYDEGDSDESAQENYVSFTVWDKKSDFSAWRKGDAFKEAHGGTSIGAFLSTMINSAVVLRGPPRPALYDGLLVQSTKPAQLPEITVEGWRKVNANGIDILPAECFVEVRKYYVSPDQAAEFERLWQQQRTNAAELSSSEGFVAFSLMRRDGQAKGHGMGSIKEAEPTYVSVSIFADSEAHKQYEPVVPPKLGRKDPESVFYQGTLVISNGMGA
jgi:heme-degrading monooxygenase HmoA